MTTTQATSTTSFYDAHIRNPEARKFYQSALWKKCRAKVLAATPWCTYSEHGQLCGKPAEHVHHKKPLKDCSPAEKIDPANLQPLCQPHHNATEAALIRRKPLDVTHVAGMLDLAEDEIYFYDAEAAEKPIRFIERFCRHFEGRHAGKMFLLEPIQKRIIGDVYGWKSKTTGYRRFNQVFYETAVGSGKSFLLAGIGLYEIMASENGQQVISCASNYSQCKAIFDAAKAMIDQSPELSKRLIVTQYEIRHPRSRSTWRIISGGKGKVAGLRPGCILADECHEWGSGRDVYDSLQGRMSKRDNATMWIATNSGQNRQTLCYTLHEEAAKTLKDPTSNPALYPVIWAASSPACRIDDPEEWKRANPLIGTTIQQIKVAEECERSKGDPTLEARFRRLYLSQWVQGNSKWLNVAHYDECTAQIDPQAVKDLPVYVGLDLSEGDDLCAATFTAVSPSKYYVESKFWLPKETAVYYEQKHGIPYTQWSKSGHIELIPEQTINSAVRTRIANYIIEFAKTRKVIAVCYDTYKADEVIALLTAANIKCIAVRQGYTLSPGCNELESRLKEKTIQFQPNNVMRSCAEIVEVKRDDRNNIWPCKPKALNRYAGTRSSKIDGIVSLVTALNEAKKHSFPKVVAKWHGGVWVL